ncbi:hypothetical protein FSARC_2440 [Fusarium sarcochroum]|uniref:Arginosuccinase n=1 Tax=Fusarium sarcochroum TaxID=1208366 RepID=A0A8H4XDT3_9HYPO|nr:hypothetical protein FSARC_2440 [Fusarium sarcochroum]
MVASQSSKVHSEPFTAGRLAKSTSDLLQEYVDTPKLKGELQALPSVLQVDHAHLVMLAAQGLITPNHAGALIQELEDLGRSPDKFTAKAGYGTLNLQIEEYLAQRLGRDIAGRLPIGRSRIDHGATVRRLADRNNVLEVQKGLLALQDALVKGAKKHGDTAIISFTHMQQAQPATFGHYLLAFHDRFVDTFQLLSEVYDRFNRSPLGAVGLSGTDLPIDRKLTASLLGFPDILGNSLTGRDAYYQIEIALALSMVMTLLNDLCTDLHIQSSTEFGYVELDDSHCSTSSIFPQKKNPVALEAIKLAAAESHGWVAAAQAIFRNEGTADQYYRHVPFMKTACVSTANMLHLTAEIIQGLTVHKARCEDALAKAWVTTSRLGNVLMLQHGVDYRSAHGVVGRLVSICIARGIAPGQVTVELLQEAAGEMGVGGIDLTQKDLTKALDYKAFLNDSNSLGGVGPLQFDRLLDAAIQQYGQNLDCVSDKERVLAEARAKLNQAAEELKNEASYPLELGQQGKTERDHVHKEKPIVEVVESRVVV